MPSFQSISSASQILIFLPTEGGILNLRKVGERMTRHSLILSLDSELKS